MARSLTLKQRKFVKEYLTHGSKIKAARAAYPDANDTTQTTLAYNMMRNERIVEYMREILDKQGLSDDKIGESLGKIVRAGTSPFSLEQAHPGHALKAIEMTSKMKNLFPAEKKQVEQRNATIKLNLSGKSEKELQTQLDQLFDEIKSFRTLVRSVEHIQNPPQEGEVVKELKPVEVKGEDDLL